MGNNIHLPRNIRQIGTDKGSRKVYIEDYVHSFIRDTQVDEDKDGAVGILLGETVLNGDVSYIFVRGAIEADNAAVYTDKIEFTEETWPVAQGRISRYFAGYEIVGWYLVSSRIMQDDLYVVNKADTESFEDLDSVFFMVNPETKEEIFHEKTTGGLSALSGYTVFYERNEKMQIYMSECRGSLPRRETREPEAPTGGEYRRLAEEGGQNNMSKSVKGRLTFIYALSMLLIIVVLVIGVNAINKHDGAVGGSATTNGREVNAEPKTTPEATVPVHSVPGDVTSSGEAETTEAQTENRTTEAPTEAPTDPPTEVPTEAPTDPPTEAPTAPPYQIYKVQAGDTLLKICREYYGRESMDDANRVLAYNGLNDTSEILLGMELKIPN